MRTNMSCRNKKWGEDWRARRSKPCLGHPCSHSFDFVTTVDILKHQELFWPVELLPKSVLYSTVVSRNPCPASQGVLWECTSLMWLCHLEPLKWPRKSHVEGHNCLIHLIHPVSSLLALHGCFRDSRMSQTALDAWIWWTNSVMPTSGPAE